MRPGGGLLLVLLRGRASFWTSCRSNKRDLALPRRMVEEKEQKCSVAWPLSGHVLGVAWAESGEGGPAEETFGQLVATRPRARR
jgi:hypothetical protein